eukprot:CAMPEP_0195287934 /NCGR_PEP_ID=MMETSP0707-20130614/4795_1 /TAXON_ID=33640 /ORGANISM="Asterionellopsis glacialis, Strain CCMP134" /LENGTH=600 /DNA_ID=CAMNT_0040347739 /DNA_START=152 /DNA_END=1954 /DNA_ORIENTATION=+
MTVNICEQPEGELTPEMLKATPQLMSAWSNLYSNDRRRTKKRHQKKNHQKKIQNRNGTPRTVQNNNNNNNNSVAKNSNSQRNSQQTTASSSSSNQHSQNSKFVGGRDCALAVESLLKRLIDEQRAGNPNAVPTTEAYNCIMEGWARSGEGVFAAERCEQILVAMHEQYQAGNNQVQPNYESFKFVLLAWKHVQPSQFKDYPVRAQRILEWMGRLATMKKNRDTNNNAQEWPMPDAELYDMVLQSWARSGRQDAPPKCEKLLHSMAKLYETTHYEPLKPRTSNFNAVLAAWSKSTSPASAQRASDVLGFMEVLSEEEGDDVARPDLVSYSTVVAALARSNDPHSGQYAERYLRHVETAFLQGQKDLEPDTIFYNSVMGCWARCTDKDAYRKARSILDRQISLYLNNHDNNDNKEKNQEDTLTNNEGVSLNPPQRNMKCRPDVYGFTSVIGSCAMAGTSNRISLQDKQKAFGVALSTFQQFRKSQQVFQSSPNHVTYGTMLKACAYLLPPGDPLRTKWVAKVFRMCVADGCVGDMVLSKLRECTTPPVYKELMQGYTKHNLPAEWTCNVHEQRDMYRKQPSSSTSSTTTTNAKSNHRRRAEV